MGDAEALFMMGLTEFISIFIVKQKSLFRDSKKGIIYNYFKYLN
jgi:hypothetical protein